ncbi:MAG: hypothetical protein U0941_04090 [Planctomycetaceae bacterium]
MHRVLAIIGIVLVASQIAFAATSKKIGVTGQLNGGMKVSATCTLTGNGQASGSGTLSGTGGSYPFTITGFSTAGGELTLTGKFNGVNYPLTLTSKVPSGTQTFSYVVNGKTVKFTGTGSVTIQ